MALKRKVMTSAIALSVLTLIATGTYAWTNLNSQKTNEWFGNGNAGTGPGGTLHDDHNDNEDNKDVYVENWGDEDLFVRVRLTEYMEAGQGAGLKSVSTDPIIHNPLNLSAALGSEGDIDHLNSWRDIWQRFSDPGDPALPAPQYRLTSYWNWDMGGQKFYYPAPANARNDKSYVDQGSPDNLTADSVNENGMKAKQTLPATVLTMYQWQNAGRPIGNYWVVDRTAEHDNWGSTSVDEINRKVNNPQKVPKIVL